MVSQTYLSANINPVVRELIDALGRDGSQCGVQGTSKPGVTQGVDAVVEPVLLRMSVVDTPLLALLRLPRHNLDLRPSRRSNGRQLAVLHLASITDEAGRIELRRRFKDLKTKRGSLLVVGCHW
jgi:hypothetical protein